LLWPPELVRCLCCYLKADTALAVEASMIKGFHVGARMEDLIRILEELRKEVLQLQKEVKKLKTEEKNTLPEGWRIIPGTKR